MMNGKSLSESGLDLFLGDDGTLTLGGDLVLKGMGHKTARDMRGLLACEDEADSDAWCYDTYRKIMRPGDGHVFEKYKMSYDITIIAPGTLGGECKKTSGHYHGWNPEHTNTYGEVYEVLSGTALFCLQKSPDFFENPEGSHVEDVIFVTVPAGKTLLVPPNYGHCSVNIGEDVLVFSNVAYAPCPVLYGAVKARHGMAYYFFRNSDGSLSYELNDRYASIGTPEPKFATVHEDPDLGIAFSQGAYLNFVEAPEKFDFLPHPDAYIDRIMGLLDYGDKLAL